MLRAANATATDECVPYAGHQRRRPKAEIDGAQMNASRAVWILVNGDPGAAHVLHRCHNDRCVNVAHLYLGDHDRNMLDMAQADRGARHGKARGTDHGQAMLTDDQVREIRGRYATRSISQKALGEVYGVAQTTISAIVRRETWPDLV